MENRCLFCYEIIPEGRQVCPKCMKYYTENLRIHPVEESKPKKRHPLYFIKKLFHKKEDT